MLLPIQPVALAQDQSHALHAALRDSDLKQLKTLLAKGAVPNVKSKAGWTALTFAFAIMLLMLASLCLAQADQRGPRRPNIVFILIDDLRWDELGLAGHPFIKTPHIDRIGFACRCSCVIRAWSKSAQCATTLR